MYADTAKPTATATPALDNSAGLLAELLRRRPELMAVRTEIDQAFQRLRAAFRQDRQLLVCGNGGSAADAEHIVGELVKAFRRPPPLPAPLREALRQAGGPELGDDLQGRLQAGLRALALTGHPALSTAVGNDLGGDLAFAQQLLVFGRPGDVLLGISTSGNARNVLLAAATARAKGLDVIGLTGAGGGALRRFCDVCICAPAAETYLVQELHSSIYHALCAMLEAALFGTD